VFHIIKVCEIIWNIDGFGKYLGNNSLGVVLVVEAMLPYLYSLYCLLTWLKEVPTKVCSNFRCILLGWVCGPIS